MSLTKAPINTDPFYLSFAQIFGVKKLLLLFYFIFLFFSSYSQDSCSLRISLLTCAPGEELYSTFGHTALRVQNIASGTDQVYNYGTFEFGPDFYTKFIQGKLLYFLSVEEFPDFMYQYEMQSRSIREQVIQLNCDERKKLLAALHTNAQEENRYYKYDFLFDNCTTRARDITRKNTGDSILFRNILPAEKPSFRNLIHSYLDAGKQPWSKLGIDILLGAKLDRKVTNEEAMFLPDYLLKGFDSAMINGRPLVSAPQTILALPPAVKNNGLFTPFVIFSLLLVGGIILSFFSSRKVQNFLRVFDFIFFLFLGLAGILLLFMWFGTDHTVCANNYNLFWALPTHVIAAFFVRSSRPWVRSYFTITAWISLLLLLTWFFLPQQMNNGLLPVVILILLRSWQISKKRHEEKRDQL